jgi:hypothetical protein
VAARVRSNSRVAPRPSQPQQFRSSPQVAAATRMAHGSSVEPYATGNWAPFDDGRADSVSYLTVSAGKNRVRRGQGESGLVTSDPSTIAQRVGTCLYSANTELPPNLVVICTRGMKSQATRKREKLLGKRQITRGNGPCACERCLKCGGGKCIRCELKNATVWNTTPDATRVSPRTRWV